MKKIFAVVALTALTGCATTLSQTPQKNGNWTKVVESANGIHYVDLSTVKQSSYRYAKTIRVSSTNQVIGTGRWIDCAPSPFRSKWSIADTANFENGKPVKIEVINTGKFSEVTPGSTDDEITKFICAATPVKNSQQHYAEFNSAPLTNHKDNKDSFAKRFVAELSKLYRPPTELAMENCQSMGIRPGSDAYQQCVISEANSIRQARALSDAADATRSSHRQFDSLSTLHSQPTQPQGYRYYDCRTRGVGNLDRRIECSGY